MQIRSRITANPFVTILLLRSGHYGKSRREGEKKREGEEEEGCSRSGDKDLKEREGEGNSVANSSPELNYRRASLSGMLYERCTTSSGG